MSLNQDQHLMDKKTVKSGWKKLLSEFTVMEKTNLSKVKNAHA